jgi:NADPH-dependent curcumin reductase
MADYNTPAEERRFNFPLPLAILKRAVIKGLVVYDFEPKRDAFFAEVAPWVAAGQLRFHEDRATGIDQAGAQFARLMRGDNVGKALVVLGPE